MISFFFKRQNLLPEFVNCQISSTGMGASPRSDMNVAISRASDYLFLLIPDANYENFNSLFEIKDIGRKMVSIGCKRYTSDAIEKIMFGKSMHIERITYVTSHKTTNVFNNPFTPYEIRIDDNAIDIQINDI